MHEARQGGPSRPAANVPNGCVRPKILVQIPRHRPRARPQEVWCFAIRPKERWTNYPRIRFAHPPGPGGLESEVVRTRWNVCGGPGRTAPTGFALCQRFAPRGRSVTLMLTRIGGCRTAIAVMVEPSHWKPK